MSSPTFVAEFADGVTTRMTTYCASDKKLDVARGVRLARHAYQQRTGNAPPALVKAHFERNGEVLKSYDSAELSRINGGEGKHPEKPVSQPSKRRDWS